MRESRQKLEAIEKEPWSYGFFSLLRWFETQHSDKARIGEASSPRQEPVRLGHAPKLAFSPSALSALDLRREDRPKLVSQFSGLLGPQGPLPLHITEYAFNRVVHHDDETLTAFLDIFHQRYLSLFYRSWANSQPAVQLDRAEQDRFSRYVTSLSGVGTAQFDDLDKLPASAKRRFAGLFAHQRKDGESLASMTQGYFGVQAQVQQFVGEWLQIPDTEHCRLGHSTAVASLGTTATIGARYWSVQSRFRLVLGPLDRRDFERFLPGSRSADRLISLVRNYTNDEFAWDLLLTVKAAEVPVAQLGGGAEGLADSPRASQLGWNTWLAQEQRAEPAQDAILHQQLERALCTV